MAKAKQDSKVEPHYSFFVIASERCREDKCLPCDTPDNVVDAMTETLADRPLLLPPRYGNRRGGRITNTAIL